MAGEGFRAGDRVRTVAGDLVALIGTVVEVRVDGLVVEYEVFGRPTPVQLRRDEVRRLD